MEHQYNVIYKCQKCGSIIRYGEPFTMSEENVPEFCGKVVQNQMFVGNPYLHTAPMHMIHKCGELDSGCGLAYFAGVALAKY